CCPRHCHVDYPDTRAIAQYSAAQSLRNHQYHVNTRILPRDAPPLDVLVLAPSEHKALYDAACVDSARLRFHVHDFNAVGRSAGLRSVPSETLAEGQFQHTLTDSTPRRQIVD